MKKLGVLAAAFGLALVASMPAAAAPDGKALFGSKCAMCHGQDGVAKKMAAGSKSFGDPEFKKSATVESIAKDITAGKEKMKPVKVTDEEAKAIAAYVLTLGAAK